MLVLQFPFPVLKCKYIFQVKYTEAIVSNSTGKLLWFKITKVLIAVLKKHQFIVSFIIIFGRLSFPGTVTADISCTLLAVKSPQLTVAASFPNQIATS